MAPEQVTPQPATPKVDVYAAGLILWELLTGRPSTTLPENPLAIDATLRAVANRSPESLGKLRPDLPKELIATVDAALVSSPEARTIRCADMSRSIRGAARLDAGRRELREKVIRVLSIESTTKLPAVPRPPAVPPPPRVAPPFATMGAALPAHRAEAPTLIPDGDEAVPASAHWSTSVALPSLASKLRARMASRRELWIAAAAAFAVGVAGLASLLARRGAPAALAVDEHAPLDGPGRATAAVPGGETAPPIAATTRTSGETAAAPGEASQELAQRGLAHLTVHSAAMRANVYVNLKVYGAVEEELTVPCGNRFVSIGGPANGTAEPVWLAPGRKMVIPCGESLEFTMNPRALR
jgi:hypothetical protein